MAWSNLSSLEIPTKSEVQEAINEVASQIIGSTISSYTNSDYIHFKRLNFLLCWGLINNSSTSSVYTLFPLAFSKSPYIVTTENGRESGVNSFNKVISWTIYGFTWTGDKCNGHYIAIGVKY